MKYRTRKKAFNRKYARAYSRFLRNPSRSALARARYYSNSQMSRIRNRSLFL